MSADSSLGSVAPVTVVGVDPGGRTTALVSVCGGRVSGVTVTNDGPLLPLGSGYLRDVLDALGGLLPPEGGIVRVEDVNRPSWHVAKNAKYGAATDPTGLLATAQVLGAIRAVYPDAELVPPRGNGSRPLGTYPDEFIGPREKTGPNWKLRTDARGKNRHLRSAWDVANTSPRP